jgi:hypothetical protein
MIECKKLEENDQPVSTSAINETEDNALSMRYSTTSNSVDTFVEQDTSLRETDKIKLAVRHLVTKKSAESFKSTVSNQADVPIVEGHSPHLGNTVALILCIKEKVHGLAAEVIHSSAPTTNWSWEAREDDQASEQQAPVYPQQAGQEFKAQKQQASAYEEQADPQVKTSNRMRSGTDDSDSEELHVPSRQKKPDYSKTTKRTRPIKPDREPPYFDDGFSRLEDRLPELIQNSMINKLAEMDQARRAAEEEAKRLRPTDDMLKAPIRFKDAVGRKYSFPWHICKTWKVSGLNL